MAWAGGNRMKNLSSYYKEIERRTSVLRFFFIYFMLSANVTFKSQFTISSRSQLVFMYIEVLLNRLKTLEYGVGDYVNDLLCSLH